MNGAPWDAWRSGTNPTPSEAEEEGRVRWPRSKPWLSTLSPEELARPQRASSRPPPPSTVIRWAVDTFGDELVMAASFEDIVLIDLATRIAPGIEVIFLDTEAHFPETLAFVEAVRARYDLNLTVTKPGPEAAAHPCGSEQCCQFRKVAPLRRAVQGNRAWLTSLKRADGPTRADAAHRQLGRRLRPGQDQSAGHLDQRRHRLVPGRPPAPGAPARGPGLPLHRLRPDHPSGGRGRGPAGRALGRTRQIRVRTARLGDAARRRQPLRDGIPRP